MDYVYLKFYTLESRKHDGRPVFEWLLDTAKELGFPGGTAFRAMAGFGQHARWHRDCFFELGGELPVEVQFLAPGKQAQLLLATVRSSGIDLPYTMTSAIYGHTGDPADNHS